jgi:hypothetical protein
MRLAGKAGKEGAAMLQAVHQKETSARASSIYCRWIRGNREQGAPLVAVWVDGEMRCFEREFAPYSDQEAANQDALEEPGGMASLQPAAVHKLER